MIFALMLVAKVEKNCQIVKRKRIFYLYETNKVCICNIKKHPFQQKSVTLHQNCIKPKSK